MRSSGRSFSATPVESHLVAGRAVTARRFLTDQDGMNAVNVAVAARAEDREPPDAFVRGEYHRLKVGRYRIMYVVGEDVVTVIRVDRIPQPPA